MRRKPKMLILWLFSFWDGGKLSKLRTLIPKKLRFVTAWVIMGAALLVSYTNCGATHDMSSITAASINTAAILNSLQEQKNVVFTSKCSSCHNAMTVDNPLKDVLDTNYLDTNNYINLGSPQTSPLYLKVVDGLMPPAGSPTLSSDEIITLRDWIAAEGGNFDTYLGGGGTTTSAFTPVRNVLTGNCTGCHGAGGQAPRLDVDAATLRGTLYNGAPLVMPNNGVGSRLFQSFGRMPTGGALGTNSTEAQTILTWINAGAM